LGVRAHGKHLLVDFDHGHSLHSHLGMYGSWHGYAPGERWRRPARQAGIELHLANRIFVCFNPQRVSWAATGTLAERDLTGTLGPDLSLGDVPAGAIAGRARRHGPRRLLVDVLLDQRVAAGIGNAYKSELLFLRRLRPDACVGDIDDRELGELYRLAGELIRANLGGGSRTTQFLAERADRMWVYGRYDEPCLRCGAPIRMVRLGENRRSTYWCPACQGASELAGEVGCGAPTACPRVR